MFALVYFPSRRKKAAGKYIELIYDPLTMALTIILTGTFTVGVWKNIKK